MNTTQAIANEIVDAAQTRGRDAVTKLATYGYKGPKRFSFEQLCAIQDEAKERAAAFPESIWEI